MELFKWIKLWDVFKLEIDEYELFISDDEYYNSDSMMFVNVLNLKILKIKCCFLVK